MSTPPDASPSPGEGSDFSGSSELDDETTINEAEADENPEQEADELRALEDAGIEPRGLQEQDMPIEELMRKYYGAQNGHSSPGPNPEGEGSQDSQASGSLSVVGGSVEVPNPHGYFACSDASDEEDDDYKPPELWRKEIRLGEDYQAEIPPLLKPGKRRAEEASETGSLLWRPTREAAVEEYLRRVYALLLAATPARLDVPPLTPAQKAATNEEVVALESHLGMEHGEPWASKRMRDSFPKATANLPDDEDALYLLLEKEQRVEAALGESDALSLTRFRHALGPAPDIRRRTLHQLLAAGSKPKSGQWSESECERFEEGLKAHGKNFVAIQREFLPSKRVGELVEFYYSWKKTERHDMFAARARVLKRHYHLHPDASDYMEHLLDTVEGEGRAPLDTPTRPQPFSPPPNHHVVLGGLGFASLNGKPSRGKEMLPVIDSHTVQALLPD